MEQIKISDDQNTVEVDGKKYIAKNQPNFSCVKCDFISFGFCYLIPCTRISIFSPKRNDKRNVIFKLKK